MLLNTFNISAADFQTISPGLAVLTDVNAKHGLAAFVDFGDGKIYAVTTQSLLLSDMQKFSLKDFKGNIIKIVSMQVAWDKDLIRMEITPTPSIKPFKPTTSKSKLEYFIHPVLGTVSVTSYNRKRLISTPGSIIIAGNGGITGFVSSITGYIQNGKTEKVPVTVNSKKWYPCNMTHLKTQLTLLQKLKTRTFTIEKLRYLDKMNNFIDFQPYYAQTCEKWIKEHNEQYSNYLLSPNRTGKTMAAAKVRHDARCVYYSGLRTLYSYAKSISQAIDVTPWKSNFLRQCATKLKKRALNIKNGLDSQMKQMVKQHPATKTRL